MVPGFRREAILWARIAAAALVVAVSIGTRLPAGNATPVVVSSKIDTEGALLGNMIADALAERGLPVERKIGLGPDQYRARRDPRRPDRHLPEYTGNGASSSTATTTRRGRTPKRLCRSEKSRRCAEPSRVAHAGVRQQHLGYRDPQRPRRVPGAQLPRRPGGLSGDGRPVQARRLGGICRKPGGAAGLREYLRVSSARRPAADIVRRQHGGDDARRGRGHLRGQRRDGLWHRWRTRGAASHRPMRRQRRADRLCAGAGRAAGSADGASGDRRDARRRSSPR